MTQSPLTYLKLSIVGLMVVGIFVLAALGKLDPTTATATAVAAVSSLVVALGLSSGGQQIATAVEAHTRAMLRSADTDEDIRRRLPPPAQRGFVGMRLVSFLAGLGVALAITVGAVGACTAAQGQQVETVGENIAECIGASVLSDIIKGITDPGTLSTDAIAKCFVGGATPAQQAATETFVAQTLKAYTLGAESHAVLP